MLYYAEFLKLRGPSNVDLDDPENYAVKITLRGNLSLDNSGELFLFVKILSAGGMRRLAVNLEHLAYIDSSGIGLIIQIRKHLKAVNGDFALLNVPPKISEAFDLVNLKEYVQVFYSDDKLIDYFRNRRLERSTQQPMA